MARFTDSGNAMAELPLLGHCTIDTLHEEMLMLLLIATSAPDSTLRNNLVCLQRHCEHHFAQEELLMVEHHFAGYKEHRSEHQQLLAEFNGMDAAAARGRQQLVRAWLRERVSEWFRLHVRNMDSLLVSHFRKGEVVVP